MPSAAISSSGTRFSYRAMAASGKVVFGELDGVDERDIINRLNAQGLLPIHAAPLIKKTKSRFTYELSLGRGLPARELALFSQQLARLLRAGLALERGLEILTSLAGNSRARLITQQTLDAVRDGASLSDAMAKQSKSFPVAYVSMVRAGEVGGALQTVLARLADFLVRSEAIRQKIISAMIYPAILCVVAIASITIVLTMVLPEFAPMFADAGAKLPLTTQIVMAAGALTQAYWWVALLGSFASVVLWKQFMRITAFAIARDRIWLTIPVIRELVVKFEVGKFSRTLGVLLANGVPAARALALCGTIVSNRILAHAIKTAADQLKEGDGLCAPLEKSGRLPTLSIQLIRIGEETGKLDDMLLEIADIYDQDVQRLMDRLLALLVPAITIVMGGVVAMIIASVMTAMMSINDLVL